MKSKIKTTLLLAMMIAFSIPVFTQSIQQDSNRKNKQIKKDTNRNKTKTDTMYQDNNNWNKTDSIRFDHDNRMYQKDSMPPGIK